MGSFKSGQAYSEGMEYPVGHWCHGFFPGTNDWICRRRNGKRKRVFS